MDKVADTSSSGFKSSSPNGYFVTSTNLPSSSPPASKISMHHHHQGNTPIAAHDGGGGGGGGGGANNQTVGNIYGGENCTNSTKLQQPFDIYPFAYSTIPYKSPGGSRMGFNPFTYTQWKELERQAMVYKYMISSVPVPVDLLFPISTTNFPSPAPPISSMYNGRYAKNGDLEPGRCKRTDGKKWRCSRDVAPTQKYCERHLHRGRPRSRKPVELKIDNPNPNSKINHKKSRTIESDEIVVANQPQLSLFNPKTDLTVRDLGLNDVVQMQNLTGEANEGFSDYRPIFQQDYLDAFSYPNFAPPEIEVPNYEFIDAWSIGDNNNLNNNKSGSNFNVENQGDDFSPSLNLSMNMSDAGDCDLDREIRMNSRIEKFRVNNYKDPICNWDPFVGGGPLGEALSSPATTVSSPSGVLQRTLFSDGSVCNSPTFAAAAAEAPFQWLN